MAGRPSSSPDIAQRDTTLRVRPATPADGAELARIYNHYVINTTITFEETPVAADDLVSRVAEAADAGLPYLVAESAGALCGFAYASRWKGRCAYRFSVESTVYVDVSLPRRGIGSRLYEQLLPRLRDAGIHAVIGGIALPNEASIALHERFGFTKVASFREVGFKFGRWIDVGYWQLLFEPTA